MNPSLSLRKATKLIVVHCSASQPDPKTDVATIDRWHRQRGFVMVGYHWVIKTDGTVQAGRPDNTIGAHVQGFNAESIGICMVGGVDAFGKSKDNFTAAQYASLKIVIKDMRMKYPTATKLVGHRDLPFVKKDCPCFDVQVWAKKQGL